MGKIQGRKLGVIRQALIERDGPQCQWCGVTIDELAERGEQMSVDHVVPDALGGSDDLENLQLLCGTDNARKGSQDAGEIARPVRFSSGVARAGFTVAHNIVLFNGVLTPLARLLYFQLRHFAWADPDRFPGQDELAAGLGIGARMLRRYVRELEDALLLRTERRGRGMTNAYVVMEPASPTSDRNPTSGLERTPSSAQSGHPPPVSKNKKTEDPGRAKARPRDQLFDELATRCGFDLSAMTKDSSRLCAVATAEIRKAGATVEMIGHAVTSYERLYPGAAVTPKAIANHWPKIAPRAKSPALAVCPECSVGGGLHLSDCPTLTPA